MFRLNHKTETGKNQSVLLHCIGLTENRFDYTNLRLVLQLGLVDSGIDQHGSMTGNKQQTTINQNVNSFGSIRFFLSFDFPGIRGINTKIFHRASDEINELCSELTSDFFFRQ